MHMFMRKDNRRVSVMISRCLFVEDLDIFINLILIHFEKEVRLSLDIAIDILCESLPLLTFELLLKVESIKFLLNKFGNAALDLLKMIMITLLNL